MRRMALEAMCAFCHNETREPVHRSENRSAANEILALRLLEFVRAKLHANKWI
jgi:hypothetical protein